MSTPNCNKNEFLFVNDINGLARARLDLINFRDSPLDRAVMRTSVWRSLSSHSQKLSLVNFSKSLRVRDSLKIKVDLLAKTKYTVYMGVKFKWLVLELKL